MKYAKQVLAYIVERPLLAIPFYFIVWEFLYMLTGLPNLLANPNKPDWHYYLFNYGILGSVNYVLFCLMAFLVIPKLFVQKRKLTLVVIISIIAAFVFTYIKGRIELWDYNIRLAKVFAQKATGPILPNIPLGPLRSWSYMRSYVWFSFIIIIIAFAFQLALVWFKNEKIRKELETQKLQAELSFLKMQINPHFLFNALNNIYSLAVLEKAGKTGENIMKLSELIRYMLYEKEDEENKVSLDKEINHINSFIDLQKLRHEGDTYIHFSIEGNTSKKKIPPLLLFPLIENSFKHGILQDRIRPVAIQLKVTDEELAFTIHNHKNNYLKDRTGGIGLTNVRKRLNLLYPGKHLFTIRDSSDEFSVDLKLPL